MNNINFSQITDDDLKNVKRYLESDAISNEMLDYFIELSIRYIELEELEYFEEDEIEIHHLNNFLEIPQLYVLFQQLIKVNYDYFYKLINLNFTTKTINTLLIEIKNEKIKRFKEKLELSLNKSTKGIDIRFKI